MGTDTGIMLKAQPVLSKAHIVIVIIANARKAMFIVEDMEKEDTVCFFSRKNIVKSIPSIIYLNTFVSKYY